MSPPDSEGYQSTVAGSNYNESDEYDVQPGSAVSSYSNEAPQPGAPPEEHADTQPGSVVSGYGNEAIQPGSLPEGDADTKPGSAVSGYGNKALQPSSRPEETGSAGDFLDDGGEVEEDGSETKTNFSRSDEESPSRNYGEEEVNRVSTRERKSRFQRGDDTTSDRDYLDAKYPGKNYSRAAK